MRLNGGHVLVIDFQGPIREYVVKGGSVRGSIRLHCHLCSAPFSVTDGFCWKEETIIFPTCTKLSKLNSQQICPPLKQQVLSCLLHMSVSI